MDKLIEYVSREMRVIGHAPVAFFAAVLVLAGGIWSALDWRYSGVIANRDAEISSLRTQRDEYKEKAQRGDTRPSGAENQRPDKPS